MGADSCCDSGAELTPPIVCTLSEEARPDRANAWIDVLAQSLERESTATGVRLRFAAEPQIVATLASLAVREVECCAFFSFKLAIDGRGVWLAVDAPPDARPVVDELFGTAQATATPSDASNARTR